MRDELLFKALLATDFTESEAKQAIKAGAYLTDLQGYVEELRGAAADQEEIEEVEKAYEEETETNAHWLPDKALYIDENGTKYILVVPL